MLNLYPSILHHLSVLSLLVDFIFFNSLIISSIYNEIRSDNPLSSSNYPCTSPTPLSPNLSSYFSLWCPSKFWWIIYDLSDTDHIICKQSLTWYFLTCISLSIIWLFWLRHRSLYWKSVGSMDTLVSFLILEEMISVFPIRNVVMAFMYVTIIM